MKSSIREKQLKRGMKEAIRILRTINEVSQYDGLKPKKTRASWHLGFNEGLRLFKQWLVNFKKRKNAKTP